MDDPNITMEEYIRLEEEKAQKRGKVFNWKTAKYGRIWYNEDVHDLRSVETEFPAIIFNDNLTSNETLSCEPILSSLNDNEIDFRISFEESDDEDYIVVYDENSFSYKIISVNNLKTDSENENEKVNMPSFLSPEPEVSYFNDLDFFKDFDNDKIDIEQPSGDMSVIPSPNVINVDTEGSNKLLETRPSERNDNVGGVFINLEISKEKDQRHGRTFNWQTVTYEKVKYCEDEDDCFTNFNTEFPAIVSNDTLTALSCESTVSPLNENEIDFRISFDESKNEEYMVIFDENSFSYKIIYVDDLKTDSEKDNDKIDMPSFPSPESTIIHSDDLDFFKDFENEFPAITYNDDLTSKLTKPSVSFQHIKKFDLDEETSFSEYDEEEQNTLYFNDLFPLNIVFPNDLKLDKDIDADEIDNLYVPFGIPFSPKRYYKDGVHTRILWRPRYQVERYTKDIMHNNEQRLKMIFGRSVNQRRLFEIRAPLVREFILEFLSTCRMSDTEMGLDVADTFISGRGQAPEKVTGVDLFYLRSMDRGTANVPHLLAQYFFKHAEGRKNGARLSGGYFIGRLAARFRLLSRLNICKRVGDTWAWVAPRPERQTDVAAGAPRAAEDALAVNKGAQADSALMQAPQPPPTAPRTMPQRIARLEEEVHELRQSIVGLRRDVDRSTTDQGRFTTWMVSCMTQLMDASGRTYQAFVSTLVDNS
ncbi:hypothetical protein Tco_1253607 [Tanacetum coccineum]